MATVTLVNFMKNKRVKNSLPIGCLRIASRLKKETHDVRFVDLQVSAKACNINEFVEIISDNSKYLLFSSMSMMLPWLFSTIRKIKERYPHKIVILGGPGVSPISEAILKKFSFIDYIVEGEGETAVSFLISAIEKASNPITVPNLVYRENNAIIKNNRNREDLDEIGLLDYSFIDQKDYDFTSSIITARGCPFDCTFCYNKHMWSGEVRLKTVKQIFQEIDLILKNFGVNHIEIMDDLFFLDKKRLYDFFKYYKRKSYSFKYMVSGARIGLLDKETLKNLKDTNCVSLWFGIESGSDRILEMIKKKFRVKDALNDLEMATEYIPDIMTSFIVGFPFETLNEFNKTVRLAENLHGKSFDVMLNFLRPQPRTEIYLKYKDKLFFNDLPFILKPGELNENMKRSIKCEPGLYSWYYTYSTPDLEKKMETYNRVGINSRHERRAGLLADSS